VNPRSSLRRPRQERRSVAAPTPGSDLGASAPQRATPGAPLLLYRCPPFEAWIGVHVCVALRTRGGPEDPRYPAAGRKVPAVCTACPGVLELRRRRLTPAPRRIAT
jgi:hypothetical protein